MPLYYLPWLFVHPNAGKSHVLWALYPEEIEIACLGVSLKQFNR